MLDMSVLVGRGQLGLGDLEANDGVAFRASRDQFMGAMVTWNRQQVGSPFTHGQPTVARQMQTVTETLSFEVYGRFVLGAPMTAFKMRTNVATLLAAFKQDDFTLTVAIDGQVYSYAAEAADFQITWTGDRFRARQGLVTFNMPRHPVPLAGAW